MRDYRKNRLLDSEDQVKELISLLMQAHSFIIEASELADSLYREDEISYELQDAIETLEAELSEVDFEGYGDPIEELFEKFPLDD